MKKSMAVLFNCSNGRSFINRLRQFLTSTALQQQLPQQPLHLRQLLLRQLPAEAENNTEADDSYTIGVGQFAEHGSLDNCREGFMAGLAAEGIEEGKNLTVLYENPRQTAVLLHRLLTTFAGKGVDLMCGIATPMAQAEYGVAMKSDIPVISQQLPTRLPLSWQTQTEPRLARSQAPAINFL